MRTDWFNVLIGFALIACWVLLTHAYPHIALLIASLSVGITVSRLLPWVKATPTDAMRQSLTAYMKAHKQWEKENLGGYRNDVN